MTHATAGTAPGAENLQLPLDDIFEVDPWAVVEKDFSIEDLERTESVFALSNGHVGLRGNLDEGEPHGLPGTYLNSFHERRPMPYAEAGYGYPEIGQTLIDVTNGKLIRLLVDDEPLDVRYGTLEHHERRLDLRAGTLKRELEWCSPAGQNIKVTSTRLVSFTHRSVCAIEYVVEPVHMPARVVIQSELVANEDLPTPSADPRVAAALEHPLESLEHDAHHTRITLLHTTKRSELRVAAAADHRIHAPEGVEVSVASESRPDWGRVTVTAQLQPGQQLRLVKFLSYGWSSTRSAPALRDQVAAGLTAAIHTGWDGLVEDQHAYLDDFWDRADVEVGGDPELQQAVRFGLFHVLQAGERAEERPISAKGLTGPGYDGHCFWDTECFVLPVLIHTSPRAAADALRWRHTTLDLARDRAKQLGLKGAAFPWRTITGEECSGYWPAGTAAFHINADIADAVVRYVEATEDIDFEEAYGTEILVETARLWASLGHHDRDGNFRIDGVTGPDEYSAVADNNVYTNLMAQRNLRKAAEAVGRHREVADELEVTAAEVAAWRYAADQVVIPFDDTLGVHPQSSGFTRHDVLDFQSYGPDQYPLFLHMPYFDLYRKQVIKQADLVLAMQFCNDAFTPEQKVANFAYYERLTVRDSSLSACTQAVIAAEIGHLDLAMDYTYEAAFMDLRNLNRNTRDGLHIASLAGAWIALVNGFGGMRDHHDGISFAPRLPASLTRLAFTITYRGVRVRVETEGGSTTYTVRDHGTELDIVHHGKRITVRDGEPMTVPVPPAGPVPPRPSQPAGRAPRPHR